MTIMDIGLITSSDPSDPHYRSDPSGPPSVGKVRTIKTCKFE